LRFLSRYDIKKPSNKLNSFWVLSFEDFKKEAKRIAKLKFKTSLEEKQFDEYWADDFEETKKELVDLKQKIDDTDEKIDQLVYEIYGLTDEEIKIVEGR